MNHLGWQIVGSVLGVVAALAIGLTLHFLHKGVAWLLQGRAGRAAAREAERPFLTHR